ncbi:anti-anti-sigma factor [Chloroflexus islandicus]|uniref:Anti-anti-sigma factor n=1 Tax=Chloroflexus islandicus TaxID=1707952 RepID=A0A178MFE8_9CHLR|nr:STAS domain-containing protein [Chloroflexus islandicus]OAN47481.1 anti-anti-sigma factor [Chloroflexus islandicus]
MSSPQPPTIAPTEHASTMIAQWRLQILNNLLWVLVVLGGLALVVGSWSDYNAMGERALPYIAIYAIAYVLVVSAAALRQLSLTIRAIFVLTILGAMATFLLIFFGLTGSGRLLWIGVVMLALVYFGSRGGISALAISLVTMIITAAIYVSGNATFVTAENLAVQDTISDWVGATVVYLATASLALLPFLYLLRRMEGLALQATAEAARARMHAQQVEASAAQLEQQTAQLQATEQMLRNLVQSLETPTVEIGRDVLLAPVVGQIDSQRAELLLKRLLDVVSARRVRMVVIDVAGVPAFDTMAAQSLIQTVQALRLIGCETVITGISPTTAQTITTLGIDMNTIATARSPQEVLVRVAV